MSFLAILETQKFEYQKLPFYNFGDSQLWVLVKLGLESGSNLLKIKIQKLPTMTFLDCLNSPKLDFT